MPIMAPVRKRGGTYEGGPGAVIVDHIAGEDLAADGDAGEEVEHSVGVGQPGSCARSVQAS
jgi:hypothetical protein